MVRVYAGMDSRRFFPTLYRRAMPASARHPQMGCSALATPPLAVPRGSLWMHQPPMGRPVCISGRGHQSRSEHMRQLLLSATEAHGASTHRISIEIGDYSCGQHDYALSVVHAGCREILLPDPFFAAWPEAGIHDYEAVSAEVALAGSRPALERKCGWAGTPLPRWARAKAVGLMQANATLFDVFIPAAHAANVTELLTMEAQVARWSCLVDIRGNGFSGRLPLLLHSGRPVLYVERQGRAWYSRNMVGPSIEAWRHYVPVRADLSDLYSMAAWVLEHPEQSAAIGRRARKHAQLFLTRQYAIEAMGRLLDPRGPFVPRTASNPLGEGAWSSGYCDTTSGGSCVAMDDAWAEGACALTQSGPSDCELGSSGSWQPVASTGECVARCLACNRCEYVSYDGSLQECSWFRGYDGEHACALGGPGAAARGVPLSTFGTRHSTIHVGKSWVACRGSERHARAVQTRQQYASGSRTVQPSATVDAVAVATPADTASTSAVQGWMRLASKGWCAQPLDERSDDVLAAASPSTSSERCLHADHGVFPLTTWSTGLRTDSWFVPPEPSGPGESRTWEHAVAACLELCSHCARCRHISISPVLALCAWHHRCNVTALTPACGILSGPVYNYESERERR